MFMTQLLILFLFLALGIYQPLSFGSRIECDNWQSPTKELGIIQSAKNDVKLGCRSWDIFCGLFSTLTHGLDGCQVLPVGNYRFHHTGNTSNEQSNTLHRRATPEDICMI